MCTDLLAGRQLLTSELKKLPNFKREDLAQLTWRPAMKETEKTITCQRCGSEHQKEIVKIKTDLYYCPNCIQLGRVTNRQKLWSHDELNAFNVSLPVLSWQGQLTDYQTKVAQEVKTGVSEKQRRLLWAVTGAGKTEMLFPTLTAALEQGWRVAIAAPRVDVCIELYPRFQAAFAQTSIVLLHGKQPKYEYAQLVICTTHQLLRFYHAFDLLIIDEIDSYPFVNNVELHFAAENARKPDGAFLGLTATPDDSLQQELDAGKLEISYLPRRFHGFLLPRPDCVYTRHWKQALSKGKLPNALVERIQGYLAKKQRFILFVPRIDYLPKLEKIIRIKFPELTFVTVHAQDEQRLEKVQAFRNVEFQSIFSTTILERGVTFSNIDVLILGCEERTYSTSSLVQMAGRAGRDKNFPDNQVIFYFEHYKRQIKAAVAQIDLLNHKAKQIE